MVSSVTSEGYNYLEKDGDIWLYSGYPLEYIDFVDERIEMSPLDDVTRVLKSGRKDVTVTVYRVVPTDVGNKKLKNGDWVTLSKSYAKIHGEVNLDGKYKILEQEVPVNHV